MSLPADELSFEEALARLESVVTRLESGELSLEASLLAFEEGIALQRRCHGQLNDAQQRIEILTAECVPETMPGTADRPGSDGGAGSPAARGEPPDPLAG
jgi:exodeoxyribonuclease VII small subunit